MDKEIYNFYLSTKGGWGTVSGESMEPTLKKGWRVKVEVVDEDKIKVGDIALFGKDTLICHRIIRKVNFFRQAYFIHKGDNSFMGGIFKAEDLMGRVVGVFDKEEEKIDKQRWQHNSFRNIKILAYVYLFMYLIKRFIWKDKINRLSWFINRSYWKVLTFKSSLY